MDMCHASMDEVRIDDDMLMSERALVERAMRRPMLMLPHSNLHLDRCSDRLGFGVFVANMRTDWPHCDSRPSMVCSRHKFRCQDQGQLLMSVQN